MRRACIDRPDAQGLMALRPIASVRSIFDIAHQTRPAFTNPLQAQDHHHQPDLRHEPRTPHDLAQVQVGGAPAKEGRSPWCEGGVTGWQDRGPSALPPHRPCEAGRVSMRNLDHSLGRDVPCRPSLHMTTSRTTTTTNNRKPSADSLDGPATPFLLSAHAPTRPQRTTHPPSCARPSRRTWCASTARTACTPTATLSCACRKSPRPTRRCPARTIASPAAASTRTTATTCT